MSAALRQPRAIAVPSAYKQRAPEGNACGVRPIHASASEGVELSDRRRCEKFASRERVFMTYVSQLDGAHVLPFRLPTPGGPSPDFRPPYFAIVARTTAQLKMKPVIIMNLDTS